MATVFSKLFWPEFEIISGVVVLSEGISSAGLASWKETTIKGGGRGVWDRIHVYDLFLNESVKFADEVWAYLAEILQQTWQACLNLRFPEAEANVELSFSDQDYGPTLSIDQLIR